MAVGGSNRRADSGSGRPGRRIVGSLPAKGAGNGALAFIFPSNIDEAHAVRKRILDAAQEHGFSGESFFALQIALEEALINAVKHGNQLDPRKKIHVEARVNDLRAEIMIEDEGPGFDRSAVPDPTADDNLHRCSGRGILLIEAYMHEVKWERGGRRLRMIRQK